MNQQELEEWLDQDHKDKVNSSMHQLYNKWQSQAPEKSLFKEHPEITQFTRSDLLDFALFCLRSTATDVNGM